MLYYYQALDLTDLHLSVELICYILFDILLLFVCIDFFLCIACMHVCLYAYMYFIYFQVTELFYNFKQNCKKLEMLFLATYYWNNFFWVYFKHQVFYILYLVKNVQKKVFINLKFCYCILLPIYIITKFLNDYFVILYFTFHCYFFTYLCIYLCMHNYFFEYHKMQFIVNVAKMMVHELKSNQSQKEIQNLC